MLDFLYIAVSWVLLRWHQLLTFLGMPAAGGWTWVLSIILLVITARLLLFRLFIKQVHYQRNMQRMQPKLQKLREKYKNDRAELNRQMMALQQEEGFNPLSGCLPMLLQFPVFIGLYHTLRHLANSNVHCSANGTPSNSRYLTLYTFNAEQTCQAAKAKIFNAPLAASFHESSSVIKGLGGDVSSTRIVLVILLIISAAATFFTQLLVRHSATTVAEGTAATVQRAMLYLIPLGTLASGLIFFFPLGVLLYWFTSNLWTLGQQGYIIRFHPPDEADVPPATGAVGKTLAPRPGQRPDRGGKASRGSGAGKSVNLGKSDGADGVADQSSPPSGKRSTNAAGGTNSAANSGNALPGAPRPGQRPNRQGGKRPAAKRPTQAKKRR